MLGRLHMPGSQLIIFESSAKRSGSKHAHYCRAVLVYTRVCRFAYTLRSSARKTADQAPWNNVFVEKLSDPDGPDAYFLVKIRIEFSPRFSKTTSNIRTTFVVEL